MKSVFRILLCVALGILTCAESRAITAGRSYESPKLTSGEFHIHSACMMPAEGKLVKQGMKGSEGMTKESDTWSSTLQTVVEDHLKSAGVKTLSAADRLDSSASDDELRQLLLQIQDKYQSEATQIDRHPKDLRNARYTLGDGVALLPCAAKSDVLVFVKGQGNELTGGRKTFGLLTGTPSSPMGSLVLTLADAKTGEILAYVSLLNNGAFVNDSEKAYGHALDKQFKKLGIGNIEISAGENAH